MHPSRQGKHFALRHLPACSHMGNQKLSLLLFLLTILQPLCGLLVQCCNGEIMLKCSRGWEQSPRSNCWPQSKTNKQIRTDCVIRAGWRKNRRWKMGREWQIFYSQIIQCYQQWSPVLISNTSPFLLSDFDIPFCERFGKGGTFPRQYHLSQNRKDYSDGKRTTESWGGRCFV